MATLTAAIAIVTLGAVAAVAIAFAPWPLGTVILGGLAWYGLFGGQDEDEE